MTGWSNEAYSVPLSGGTFLFVITNRHKIKMQALLPVVILWVGTAFLVFAPGNFNRIGNASIITTLKTGIALLFKMKLLWGLMALTAIAYVTKRKQTLEQLRRYQAVWFSLAVAIIFGLMAHTLPHSFTGIEFYSCILIFTLLPILFNPIRAAVPSTTLAALLTLLFCGHQYLLCRQAASIEKLTLRFIGEYRKGAHEAMTLPKIDMLPFTERWSTLQLWRDPNWMTRTMNIAYAHNSRPITFADTFNSAESSIFSDPESFFIENRQIPGTAQAYKDVHLWRKGVHHEPIVLTLARRNESIIEKISNWITGRTDDHFTFTLMPSGIIPIPDNDSVTQYTPPSFRIIRADRQHE